jgi:hypothetical protein
MNDDERLAKLEQASELLHKSLMEKRADGSPMYGIDERSKLSQAFAKVHDEITKLEHLKLQRLKVPGQSPTMTDAELEAKSAEWLLKRGFQVTKRPG